MIDTDILMTAPLLGIRGAPHHSEPPGEWHWNSDPDQIYRVSRRQMLALVHCLAAAQSETAGATPTIHLTSWLAGFAWGSSLQPSPHPLPVPALAASGEPEPRNTPPGAPVPATGQPRTRSSDRSQPSSSHSVPGVATGTVAEAGDAVIGAPADSAASEWRAG